MNDIFSRDFNSETTKQTFLVDSKEPEKYAFRFSNKDEQECTGFIKFYKSYVMCNNVVYFDSKYTRDTYVTKYNSFLIPFSRIFQDDVDNLVKDYSLSLSLKEKKLHIMLHINYSGKDIIRYQKVL